MTQKKTKKDEDIVPVSFFCAFLLLSSCRRRLSFFRASSVAVCGAARGFHSCNGSVDLPHSSCCSLILRFSFIATGTSWESERARARESRDQTKRKNSRTIERKKGTDRRPGCVPDAGCGASFSRDRKKTRACEGNKRKRKGKRERERERRKVNPVRLIKRRSNGPISAATAPTTTK